MKRVMKEEISRLNLISMYIDSLLKSEQRDLLFDYIDNDAYYTTAVLEELNDD